MSGSPRRRSTRAAAVVLAVVFSLLPAPAAAQSSLGGAPSPGVSDTVTGPDQNRQPAPPTTPADRCLPVGFSAGWELAGYETPANIDRTMRLAREAGSSHYRFVIDWSHVEPQRGRFDWSRPDAVINAARAHGISVVAVLGYTPAWARAADGDRNSPQTRPADPKAFADFARAAVSRYTSVREFELWNEPNLRQFWKPAPNVAQYTELVRAAYPAIKQVRPDATVLAGALAAAGDDGVNIPGPRFVSDMYARGAGGHFDALSFHPYNYPERLDGTHWNTMAMTDQIHRTMVARGDGAKKIWFTEFGAPSGSGPRASSEQVQGEIVAGGVAIAASRPYIGGYLAYTLKDYGTNKYDMEQNFGIVRNDWSKKAGFATVAEALGRYRC